MEAENEKLRKISLHSALRRQTALNIEYEIKVEMMHALGLSSDYLSDNTVAKQDLFDLRRRMMEDNVRSDRLDKWVDITDAKQWAKFLDAMHYMKTYSREEAHPIDLDGKPIDLQTAKDLVDEPINTYFIRKRYITNEWNDDLKNLVKGYIDLLANIYREPGEPLLYN